MSIDHSGLSDPLSLSSIDRRVMTLELQFGHIDESLKKQDRDSSNIRTEIKAIALNLSAHTLDEQKDRVRLLSRLTLVMISAIGALLVGLATLAYTFLILGIPKQL